MDTTLSTYLQTQYANNQSTAAAESINKSISGISAESSEEEITAAVKDFEAYLMEQVIKEVKDTFVDEDESDDNSISMYKDYFMDSAISEIAAQLVDEIGENVTDDFVQQIMRNYGITGVTNIVQDTESVDDATVSEEIAQTNATTVTEVLP